MSDLLSELGIEIIKHNVGEGGSAYVHKGRVTKKSNDMPLEEGTFIAIKEYKPSILLITNQLNRIHQEGEIGREINHPNVVRIFGVHTPSGATEKCFLFMQWLEGMTLDLWASNLRKNAAWDKLRSICEGILAGVAELHSKNIHHRDIKPKNVMVVDETAKIMDIGVAEITGNNEHTLHTCVKDFVGSARYASPQFILGEQFDQKDDIYSLGATFLELLTGTRPYDEIERKPVLPIAVVQHPPAVQRMRDNVPPAMKVLLEGCLHRDRARRPTLDEIRKTLEKGGQSSYVQKEIQRKATDRRGYKIIRIDSSAGGFYADVGSDNPEVDKEYTVVRQDATLTVPSLDADVQPEMWIATAELRHVHQSIGNFKLIERKWVEGKLASSMYPFGPTGHWEERDMKIEKVMVGDYVLKKMD